MFHAYIISKPRLLAAAYCVNGSVGRSRKEAYFLFPSCSFRAIVTILADQTLTEVEAYSVHQHIATTALQHIAHTGILLNERVQTWQRDPQSLEHTKSSLVPLSYIHPVRTPGCVSADSSHVGTTPIPRCSPASRLYLTTSVISSFVRCGE